MKIAIRSLLAAASLLAVVVRANPNNPVIICSGEPVVEDMIFCQDANASKEVVINVTPPTLMDEGLTTVVELVPPVNGGTVSGNIITVPVDLTTVRCNETMSCTYVIKVLNGSTEVGSCPPVTVSWKVSVCPDEFTASIDNSKQPIVDDDGDGWFTIPDLSNRIVPEEEDCAPCRPAITQIPAAGICYPISALPMDVVVQASTRCDTQYAIVPLVYECGGCTETCAPISLSATVEEDSQGDPYASVGILPGDDTRGNKFPKFRKRMKKIDATAATPAGFDLDSTHVDLEVSRDPQSGYVSQVDTPDATIKLTVTSASSYKYDVLPGGASPGTPPLATYQFTYSQPQPGSHRLQVHRIGGSGGASDWVFDGNDNDDALSMAIGSETATRVTPVDEPDGRTWTWELMGSDQIPVDRYMTKSVHNAAGHLQSKLHVQDPGGANIESTTVYYDDPAVPGSFGRVKSAHDRRGGWKTYQYDPQGRLVLAREGIGDAQIDAGPLDVREHIFLFPAGNSAGDGRAANVPQQEDITEGGVLTARTLRTFSLVPGVSGGHELHMNETRFAAPGLALNDPANQRRLLRFASEGPGGCSGVPLGEEDDSGTASGRLEEKGDYTEALAPGALGTFTPNPIGKAMRVTRVEKQIDSGTGFEQIVSGRHRKYITILLHGQEVQFEQHLMTAAGYVLENSRVTVLDGQFRPLSVHHMNGTSAHMTYGGCCGLQTQISPEGQISTFGIDDSGRRVSSTVFGAAGMPDLVSTNKLDAAGRSLESVTFAGALSITNAVSTYDASGRLLTRKGAVGQPDIYSYSPDHLTETVTRGSGAVETSTYYRDGRSKLVVRDGSASATYLYGVHADGTRWTQIFTGPLGLNSPAWTKTTTDFLGRSIRQEQPAFGGGVLATVTTYDADGRVASTQTFHELNAVSTPVSAATLYTYDALGEPVLSGLDINANGVLDLATDRVSGQTNNVVQIGADYWRESTSWTYPNENSAVPVTTGTSRSRLTGLGAAAPAPYSGVLTSESVSIDLLGNQSRRLTYTDAANQTTWSVTDTPDSNLDAVTKSVGGVTVESTSPVGEFTTYAYDDLRRPVGSTSTSGPRTLTSTTHYNAIGQLDYVEDGATNRTTFVYDDLGRRVETIDALNQSTHTAYDPEGRVLATWGATYPVAYEYDDQSRMSALYTYRGTNEITSVADILALKPAMDKTTWIYDPGTGLLTQKLDAANKGTTYTYTPAGQLATRTWARGVTTTYDYDPVTGSLTDVDYSDATPDVVNTFDRLGRQLTSAALGVVTNTFAYDPASLHLTTETWQGLVTDTLTRSADTLGRNAGFQTLGGMSLDYAYDATGRFAAITSVVATVTNVATYAYLPNSRLLTGYSMGGFTRTVDYEPDRNLIASVVNTFGTNLVSRFDYTNDALGRRTQRLDTGTAGFQPATNSFTYNIRSELETALFSPLGSPSTSSATYSYDPIGNRIQAVENAVQTDYVSNMLNQYTAINAASPSYDDDGNMLTTGSGWTLGWDGENRLVTASNANTVITNTYDPRSRRIRKQVADAGPHVSDKRFFYDGWSLLHEHDVITGTPVTHYLWGLDLSGSLQGAGGVGGLLAEIRSGNSSVAAADANGNITEYVNGGTGALSARYAYDGFGKTIATSGPSAASFSHRFSSKNLDVEIGWFYYGYRFYAPEIGRWPSRDPIGEIGGVNIYNMTANSPLNNIDLFGLTRLADERFPEVDIPGKEHDPPQGGRFCRAKILREYLRLLDDILLSLRGLPYVYPLHGNNPHQHCVWNCRMTRAKGAEFAERYAWRKEKIDVEVAQIRDRLINMNCWEKIDPERRDYLQTFADSAMQPSDFRDNQTGRNCGSCLSSGYDGEHEDNNACEECCSENAIGDMTPEGPGTDRPYGPYAQPGSTTGLDITIPWGPPGNYDEFLKSLPRHVP